MTNLYDKYILPKVTNALCASRPTMKQREKVIPLANGSVLEVGIGSGLNLPFYNQNKVNHLTAIDPSVKIWNKKSVDINKLPFDLEFIKAYAEDIPADNNSFDTIVITYALCSIPDTIAAFSEIRRVLKPNGQMIFCEHGKAPDISVRKWQNFINLVWKRLGGGCILNRDIPKIIENNGLKIINMDRMYIPGWKPASFNYWGTAKLG